MLKVSESYIIGVDITGDDESVITVAQNQGSKWKYINTVVGKDAEEVYEKLINNKSWKEKLS